MFLRPFFFPPLFRAASRLTAVTASESVAAVAVGAALLAGAATLGNDALDRVNAHQRSQELSLIVDIVHRHFLDSVGYQGLGVQSLSPLLPSTLTARSLEHIALGGDRVPVRLWPGSDLPTQIPIRLPGVNDVRTFAVLVGDASFPVHGTAHCAAMVGAFFPDDSNLRGFQIRSVRHDDPDSSRVFAPPRSLHSSPGLPVSGNLTSWRVTQEAAILPDVLPLLSLRTTDIVSACAVFAGPDAAGALLAFSFL